MGRGLRAPKGQEGKPIFFSIFKIFNFALKIFWFNYTETVHEYTEYTATIILLPLVKVD